MVDVARALDDDAADARARGAPSLAYQRVIDAWSMAASIAETSMLVQQIAAGDLDGARAHVRTLEESAAFAERALVAIGEQANRGDGDPLALLAAFEPAVAGLAARLHATDGIARIHTLLDVLARRPAAELAGPAAAADVVAIATPALVTVTRAMASATRAVQALRTLGPLRATPPSARRSPPAVHRLARSFQSAAAANVTYFEALLGIDDDGHRRAVAGRERDYLVAYTAANLPRMPGTPEQLRTRWGAGSPAWGLFTLAAQQLAYGKASILISRWYSLRVRPDAVTGELELEHGHEDALANMLASAERKAREHAAAAAAAGAIPLAARADYRDARLLAAGDVESRLEALELYWRSSAMSQLAVMLARP
jgi:hypothetical protein